MTLRLEREGSLARLRLDKGRGNAIDDALVADLRRAADELAADDSVRGVLLASAHPKLFCPGLDLVTLLGHDRPAMKAFMSAFVDAVWALYGLRQPMVAAVSGAAVAGGCVLALTADYRVLRRGAPIGLNEVKVGVPLPWSVTALLRASVPPTALTRIALLGRNFTDEEAVAVGLVDEVCDEGQVEATALERLAELSDKEPSALAATKACLREPVRQQMRARETEHLQGFLEAWFSPATRERIQAIVASLRPRS